MASEYAADSKQECFEECLQEYLVEPPLGGEEETVGEPTDRDSMISLLEENARLRGLVLKLTNLIRKDAPDRG